MENSIRGKPIYNIAVFATWTVTSFLCHQFGKTFLNNLIELMWQHKLVERNDSSLMFGQIFAALVLTAAQMAFCTIFVSLDEAKTISASSLQKAKLWHVLATAATNISMAVIASSSTFSIKMLEPVTSAVVQYFRMGIQLSPLAMTSLPFIVGGAIGFAGNPLATLVTMPGMLSAFASNIILAFRNIEIKSISSKSNSLPFTVRFVRLRMTLPLSVIILLLSASNFYEASGYLPDHSTKILLFLCLSAMFHVVYSYVSTALVLTQISVVSHAVANIMKRLLVVLLLYLFGQRIATAWNFAGLCLCTLGLLAYAWDKSSYHQQTLDRTGVSSISGRKTQSLLTMFVIGFCVIVVYTRQTVSNIDLGLTKSLQLPTPIITREEPRNISIEMETFKANGYDAPYEAQLLPSSKDLPIPIPQDILDFLKLPSHADPTSVNYLSEKLTTSEAVTREARRLHFNIIGREIQKFKYAFVFDIAAFENKGDPAITVGEIYLLARMGVELKYYCAAGHCSDKKLEKARELAKQYSPDELVILCHGGGNIIGYAVADFVRFKVLELFPTYKILVFPQSIWVRSYNSHVNNTMRKYCCHPNLTIILRDALSYSIAKKLYQGSTRLIMAPDMAFQIGRVERFMSPVFDVMWIKRKDGETPGYQPPKKIPMGLKVHISDWFQWLTPRASNNLERAFYVATNGMFFLQRGRVVITDRLHGHILSTLLDIPHVLIDNKAKKLSSYHNTWTRSVSNVVITDDPSKALDLAIGLLKKYNETLPPVVPYLNIQEDFKKTILGVPDMQFA